MKGMYISQDKSNFIQSRMHLVHLNLTSKTVTFLMPGSRAKIPHTTSLVLVLVFWETVQEKLARLLKNDHGS
jgi:hypothetical protein